MENNHFHIKALQEFTAAELNLFRLWCKLKETLLSVLCLLFCVVFCLCNKERQRKSTKLTYC